MLESFDEMFRRRVIEDKESYLMTELLKDIKEISQDYGLQAPPIRFTSALKAHLQDTFADLVSFSKVGKLQVRLTTSVPVSLHLLNWMRALRSNWD